MFVYTISNYVDEDPSLDGSVDVHDPALDPGLRLRRPQYRVSTMLAVQTAKLQFPGSRLVTDDFTRAASASTRSRSRTCSSRR